MYTSTYVEGVLAGPVLAPFAATIDALPLAHTGHWLAGLLYLAPVFLLGGGILIQRRRDRRDAMSREVPDRD